MTWVALGGGLSGGQHVVWQVEVVPDEYLAHYVTKIASGGHTGLER